jgi:NADPH:quinone reductase-like Zn-dependent oxidoreductase
MNTQTMKAIVQDEYGTPDVLRVEEIERPRLDAGGVLVRVRAASVNPPDIAGVTGVPYVVRPAFGLRRPRGRVRGTDLAGVVEEAGRDVTGLRVGDEVFGEMYPQAGARDQYLLTRLDAGHVVDYTREDFTEGPERYDVILDNVLRHSLTQLVRVVNREGTLIPNGGQFWKRWTGATGVILVKAPLLSLVVPQRIRSVRLSQKRAGLLALTALLESGRIKPVIGPTYPLSRTPDAVAEFAAGHALGKLVIAV